MPCKDVDCLKKQEQALDKTARLWGHLSTLLAWSDQVAQGMSPQSPTFREAREEARKMLSQGIA